MKLNAKKMKQAEKLDTLEEKGGSLNRKQRRFHSAVLRKVMAGDEAEERLESAMLHGTEG